METIKKPSSSPAKSNYEFPDWISNLAFIAMIAYIFVAGGFKAILGLIGFIIAIVIFFSIIS